MTDQSMGSIAEAVADTPDRNKPGEIVLEPVPGIDLDYAQERTGARLIDN